MEKKTPSDEGKTDARHGPTGYYEEYPCTCEPRCELPCKGDCGCEACNIAYNDFLSLPSD